MKTTRFILFLFIFLVAIFSNNNSYADKSSEEASIIHLDQVKSLLRIDISEIIPTSENKNIYEIYRNQQLTH